MRVLRSQPSAPLTPALDPLVTSPSPAPQGYFTVNDAETGKAVPVTNWRLADADTYGRKLAGHLAVIAAAARKSGLADLSQFAAKTDPLSLRRLNPKLLEAKPEIADGMYEAEAAAFSR